MSEIKVAIEGSNFTLNGEPALLKMRTSFGLTRKLLDRRYDSVHRWLERVKSQGYTGIRLFGETDIWGPPFFDRHSTKGLMWDTRQTGSGVVLSDKNKHLINDLVDLLVEYDLIAEYCVVATLKGGWTDDSQRGIGYVTHMLRATSEFLQEEQFPNLLPEAINEYDAHAFPGLDREIPAIARRWRTRDYPGSLLGISAGGEWDVGYGVGDEPTQYSHVNIHPPRGGAWTEIPNSVVKELNSFGKPVYLNETMHYMTQEQWDKWIPLKPSWAGISTTNAEGVLELYEKAKSLGWSFCFHDFVGMESDDDYPTSPAESLLAEGSVPPRAWVKFRHVIELAYRDILQRPADPEGLAIYDKLMREGMSEEQLRAILLRSQEYDERFSKPGVRHGSR